MNFSKLRRLAVRSAADWSDRFGVALFEGKAFGDTMPGARGCKVFCD